MGSKPAQTTVIQQAPPAPVAPPPAPPVTTTSAEVAQSALDVRQQELLKKNVMSTIRAGDTGGWRGLGMPGAKTMGRQPPTIGGNPYVPPQGKG